jgi:hypothetical protein
MALQVISRQKPLPKNRAAPEVEGAVVEIAISHPAYGQQRAANELCKRGIFISPGGVRCVWQRHNLETFSKRLKALEAKVAQEGMILSEAQLAALERNKEKNEAGGETETLHSTFLTYPATLINFSKLFISDYLSFLAVSLNCCGGRNCCGLSLAV